jgi:hypothetical protein
VGGEGDFQSVGAEGRAVNHLQRLRGRDACLQPDHGEQQRGDEAQ